MLFVPIDNDAFMYSSADTIQACRSEWISTH